ncbi:MAG: hypothetical protein IJ756_04385 [Paludibacteraceae bacterium]|nr:hypothetical protein [Paludibacteraceae bacterium]
MTTRKLPQARIPASHKNSVLVQLYFSSCSLPFNISFLDVASLGGGEHCKHCVFTLALAQDFTKQACALCLSMTSILLYEYKF